MFQHKPANDDRMQVDAARLERLTPKERIKLAKEGRCFKCREEGHMSADCPTNTNNQGNQQGNQQRRPWIPREQWLANKAN